MWNPLEWRGWFLKGEVQLKTHRLLWISLGKPSCLRKNTSMKQALTLDFTVLSTGLVGLCGVSLNVVLLGVGRARWARG